MFDGQMSNVCPSPPGRLVGPSIQHTSQVDTPTCDVTTDTFSKWLVFLLRGLTTLCRIVSMTGVQEEQVKPNLPFAKEKSHVLINPDPEYSEPARRCGRDHAQDIGGRDHAQDIGGRDHAQDKDGRVHTPPV